MATIKIKTVNMKNPVQQTAVLIAPKFKRVLRNETASCNIHHCSNWGEPEWAPHWQVSLLPRLYLYIYIYMRRTYGLPYANGQDGHPLRSPLCATQVLATYSFKREGNHIQHEAETQTRIQTSDEGIAPTNLPPHSRISQDFERSSQQITPLCNSHRNDTKKNTTRSCDY